MLKVKIHDGENLPISINAELFADAAQSVGRMLGISGTLMIRIRRSVSGMLAATVQRNCRFRTIDFYDHEIREEAKDKPRRAIRDCYALTLAHELAHISQDMRGSEGLPPDVEELEAMKLEEVYGPVIMDILKGE